MTDTPSQIVYVLTNPAMLGLVVSELFRAEYLLEVEVIAAKPA